ncbi:MAG TPA: hypothetical protein VEY91_04815 [Candidatus Limnocylindria bacterium]|nr:hypothetical protein [Candidatus Limnocylindria bacterium]
MDHYIPKRRIPVTLWSSELQGVQGHLFLDLDAAGNRHQTLIEKVNESTRFLPLAVGPEGRIHLFNKHRLARVTAGRHVIQSDIFARGFQPWREEEAEVSMADGAALSGRIWMPLQRESQRISDFMNQHGWEFFALITPVAIHLVNTAEVVDMKLAESAGAPLVPVELGGESSYY